MKTKLMTCRHSNYEVLGPSCFTKHGGFPGKVQQVQVLCLFLAGERVALQKHEGKWVLPYMAMQIGCAFPETVRLLEAELFAVPSFNPGMPTRKMPKICGMYQEENGRYTVVLSLKVEHEQKSDTALVSAPYLLRCLSDGESALVAEALGWELTAEESLAA